MRIEITIEKLLKSAQQAVLQPAAGEETLTGGGPGVGEGQGGVSVLQAGPLGFRAFLPATQSALHQRGGGQEAQGLASFGSSWPVPTRLPSGLGWFSQPGLWAGTQHP